MQDIKECPYCKKNPGFHYTYTTYYGVFCNVQCANKFEENLKTKGK